MTEPAPDPAPLLRALLDGLREGVLVFDLDGRLREHNARARELLALDEAGLSALTPHAEAAGHSIPPLAGMWPMLVRGDRRLAVFRGQDSRGAALSLEVCAYRLGLGDGHLVVVELRDVTTYKQAEKALADSKKQLEGAVLVRTRELQHKLALIDAQQKALLELSTPVIQVWEGVLVLPLIGEIDDARAAQVTESVLASIARTTSRHVIIDLTGVPALGEAASSALLRTIRAVQLLGAGCSLTGISPAVARGLAGGEVEWSRSVRVFADLQAALKVAIAG